ncbi:MAG: exosortase [Planctomycetota bacterium]|jgi:exosortase
MNEKNVTDRKIEAVILAGPRDFGRCPIASRLPPALWPVGAKSVLERLLAHLSKHNVKQATVCSNGDHKVLRAAIDTVNWPDVEFLEEELPSGTAGCIRDAAGSKNNALLLAFSATMVSPPNIDMLIRAHRQGRSDLTVVFNPPTRQGNSTGTAADIYVCEPTILEHVPKAGYFDMKEGLIPEMLRAGNFRDRPGYLHAVGDYLEKIARINANPKPPNLDDSRTIRWGTNATVDPSARIYGPVAIMNGVRVCQDVVVFGPAIIGNSVTVGRGSMVANSVIWDHAQLGPDCHIQECIVDYRTAVPANTLAREQAISAKPAGILERPVRHTLSVAKNGAGRFQRIMQIQLGKMHKKLPVRTDSPTTNLPWLAAGLVFAAFLWSYRDTLLDLWRIWEESDEYSSGLLVPFAAGYVLWSRRRDIMHCRIKPSIWGLFAFLAAQAVRLFGLFFMYGSAERLSIVLSIAALVLLIFGSQLFRKVRTVLLFLCLMLPWPNRVQAAVTLPLQRWATSSAVFCLELLGYEVVQEGNIIRTGQATVAIAEACNGLRMITAFFVISGLVVLLVQRAWWEKLVVLASSLPIALLCNTVRLTITALAFTVLHGEYWERIFHDFGGYAMMPLALAAVVAELWLLVKLTRLPPTKEKPIMATS